MRYFIIAVLSALIFAAACCSPRAATLPTAPSSQPAAYAPAAAPAFAPEAVATARRILDGEGYTWVSTPEPRLAQLMTYAEAAQRIPALGGGEPQKSEYWPDAQIWLVILEGQWDLVPMGPPGAPANRYQGCLMVLFTAADGRIVAGGDTLCPGQ